MSDRKKFRLSEEDHAERLEACKPVPAIALQCGPIRSPQQNANAAWQRLGDKIGFDHMTVEPDGPDTRNFTAVSKTRVLARFVSEEQQALDQITGAMQDLIDHVQEAADSD